MRILFVLLFALIIALPLDAVAQSKDEKEAVRQAVLDYVEGIYEVNPSRIERSVHPDLAKRGFYIKRGENGYTSAPMNFQQLLDVARNYNKGGKVPKDAPKDITVFDVLDQTASAKLVAVWGIDYMHLAKYDGRWMIVNVLWQTPPKP